MKLAELVCHKLAQAWHLLSRREYFEILVRLCYCCLPLCLLHLRKHFIVRLDVCPFQGRASDAACLLKRAEPADLHAILNCLGVPDDSPTAHVFRDFWQMGNKCFLIELPGEAQAMGICWVFGSNYTLTYARYADKNIVFSLPPDAVFIGNAFVSPHYRRRGVYSRLLAGVASGLRWPTHTSQILAAVESGNDQSRKAHAKNGFVTVAAIYYVSFLQTAVLLAWPLKGRPFFVRLRSNTRLIRILGDGTIAPSSHRVA